MTIYLAGPITGVPRYRMRFAAVALKILAVEPRAIILNPAILPEGMRPADYMAICLPMLMRADAVFLLPGWDLSGGARIEKGLADYLRIRTVEVSAEALEKAMEELRK